MEACTIKQAEEAVRIFFEKENITGIKPYGSGHINSTFLLSIDNNGEEKQYILQRINTDIFRNPDELMQNIENVTNHLRKKIIAQGGDPERETLNIVKTADGKLFYNDESGNSWRIYKFIENAVCYDIVSKPEDFYNSAVSFGTFQKLLSDFPAKSLFETIPAFHNTVSRYSDFEAVVKRDPLKRAAGIRKEINFVLERSALAGKLGELQESGSLPLRVTHNDTKLNNIMIDKITGKGICVIDLDTVMPGLAVNDFGDSIRFGANTAAEDETDLSKVSCSMDLFSLYTKGFIEGLDGSLTQEEIRMLPVGAMAMTYECGMRFLGDYIAGDTYFKIARQNHNLDRARCQFALLSDMEQKEKQMNDIVMAFFSV